MPAKTPLLEYQRPIIRELIRHAPFTALGATTGIIIMVAMLSLPIFLNNIFRVAFHSLHFLHILLSAFVTTSMYRLYKGNKIWALLIGYTGSIFIGSLSDIILPFLGGTLIRIEMEFHLPFIEEWWLISPLAFLGIALAYLKPLTRCPHAGHVFLSTWASLFYLTAFGATNWLPLIPLVFLILFVSVWLPCCFSDIVFPLLFAKGWKAGLQTQACCKPPLGECKGQVKS